MRRLDGIGAHIAKDSPAAAANVVSRIVASAQALAAHPAMGRVGRIPGTRELVMPSLPYIIAYRVMPDKSDSPHCGKRNGEVQNQRVHPP